MRFAALCLLRPTPYKLPSGAGLARARGKLCPLYGFRDKLKA